MLLILKGCQWVVLSVCSSLISRFGATDNVNALMTTLDVLNACRLLTRPLHDIQTCWVGIVKPALTTHDENGPCLQVLQ